MGYLWLVSLRDDQDINDSIPCEWLNSKKYKEMTQFYASVKKWSNSKQVSRNDSIPWEWLNATQVSRNDPMLHKRQELTHKGQELTNGYRIK